MTALTSEAVCPRTPTVESESHSVSDGTVTEGLIPTRPIWLAGSRTDPPASVPREIGVRPEATATAEPLLDSAANLLGTHAFLAGGTRSVSQG